MSIALIQSLSDLTSTAAASYGTLERGDQLKPTLTNGSGNAKFSETQADAFIAKYDLLDQLPNVALNGFSATVFLDKQNNGKHILAIRGTEANIASQAFFDGFATDGLSIGGNGFANNQAVELYRYYRRLTTVGGQTVVYSDQETWQLFAMKNSLLVPLSFAFPVLSLVLKAQFDLFKIALTADKGVVAAINGTTTSVLSPTEKIDVTGHSLGGHLALLFARLFPVNVDQVVTLNAPGLFPQGDLALRTIGFPPANDSQITRIEAEGDLVSKLGLIWPGRSIRIAQETFPGAGGAVDNHSSANGNDALALMATLAKLDLQFKNDAAGISQILRGGSNVPEQTFEGTLDAVRKLL
jgi:Lipase (class 3)